MMDQNYMDAQSSWISPDWGGGEVVALSLRTPKALASRQFMECESKAVAAPKQASHASFMIALRLNGWDLKRGQEFRETR
jgi:hypothetical protein